MLSIVVGILVAIIIILILYIIFLQLQLRSINRQLDKRLKENTRQPLSLELINSELNKLAANINKCLKVEESLRLNSIREEKQFKEMIANISHDLRTPLTALKGYQQLMHKGSLTDEQKQKLQVAQKYSDELGHLIERFFEYSFLVSAEPKLNLERVNLTNLVTECLAGFISRLEEKKLTVHLEETSPVYVHADRELMTRIIQNLIRNCLAHSAGDINVKLSSASNATISFKNPVKNTTEIDVKRIFDRFYTADKARGKSTGLGLSIVKLLAERMGGSTNASMQGDVIEIIVELPLIHDK